MHGRERLAKTDVVAGAQHEHLLQQRDALAHRAGTGKRTEVAVAAVERAAMEAQLREGFAGEADVRIALVVAEQDVVARLVRLDEVVLEQQRLAFGARDRGFDARDLRHHGRDARLVAGLLEIAGDALLEVARLAHVQRFAGGVEHAVHARAGAAATRGVPRNRSLSVPPSAFDCRRHAELMPPRPRPAQMRHDGVERGVEHRRSQAARIGVVAAAVIAVDQQPAAVQRMRGAVREGERRGFQRKRAQRRFVRDAAERQDRAALRHARQVGCEVVVAGADFDGRGLVCRRQALDRIGDAAVDEAQAIIASRWRAACVAKP